ncbi:endo-1,4-beta-xylanase [Spirochaetia bacterium]|nr:endo-1,4-beta-xylanase [Spirochaetia bacterium]
MPPENFDKTIDGVAYGAITEVSYSSSTTGAARKCLVYLPPNYDAAKTYPVLYLLHGIGGIHTEWTEGTPGAEAAGVGYPNEILSNLIASGEMPPAIAVFPNIRARANDEDMSDFFGPDFMAAFANFINDLRDDLMPFIKNNYPVSDKREQTAIAGLSMGGMESLFIGISMPETFGYIGAFSPAPGLLSSESAPGRFSAAQLTLPAAFKYNTLVFIINGKEDEVVGTNPLNYHEALQNNGVVHTYYTIDGGHDFGVWNTGLYNFAKRIFQVETSE